MLTLSYNLSTKLQDNLDKIELVRRDILVLPLPPKVEFSLRWEATLSRIYYAMALEGKLIKSENIEKILIAFDSSQEKKNQESIIKYKKALDYIDANWRVTQKPLKTDDILALYEIGCYGKLRISKKELDEILQYLQKAQENPVISAAIGTICFTMLRPFTDDNDKMARLLGTLLLQKSGYDFRQLFSLPEIWSSHIITINAFIKSFRNNSNITLWLEDFAFNVLTYAEQVKEKLYSSAHRSIPKRAFSNLTERQKEILLSFDYPDAKVTNKKVQAKFHVSQITASRDLQKLSLLGLLFSRGKGRSVYYTRS